ncbi:hypothetical protein U1Q18_032519, partial [Sarracenia purpurea var. burkii]
EVHIPQYFSVPYKPLVDMHHSSSNVHKNPSSTSTFPNDRNSHATDLSVHENSSLNATGSDNSAAGSDNSAAVSDNSAAVSNHSAVSSDSCCVPITETCPPASLSVKPVHPMLTRSKCGIVKPKIPLSLLVTKSAFLDTEPKTYAHASTSEKWIEAMNAEYAVLVKQGT